MSDIKLKKGLLREVEERKEEARKQEELRKKHNLEEGVVVVEKNNTFKFLIKLAVALFKTLLGLVLIVLSAVGVITLIYPNVRMEFLDVFFNIIDEALSMVGINL